MNPLEAKVINGRYVIEEQANLPEGTELYLVPADGDNPELSLEGVELVNTEGDELSAEERARLHGALKRSVAQAKAGKLIPADEVMSKLRSRG